MAFEKILKFFERVLIGSFFGSLIRLGFGLLSIGFGDILIYGIDTFASIETAKHPGESIGYLEIFGVICVCVGLAGKFLESRLGKITAINREKLHLKENFLRMSDAKVQDEFERLYKVKNIDIKSIRRLLAHPTNKNAVIYLFCQGHRHVLVKDSWFVETSKFLMLRYNISHLVWCLLPLSIIGCIIFSVIETVSPGITRSGPHAEIGFAVLGLLTFCAAYVLLMQLRELAHAVALVRKYHP
jgi:hypothetical protein